jgi:hypothetical protein
LSCQGITSGPPLTVPPFKEPIGTTVVFQSPTTAVNIFIRSSSNHRHQYFVQKLKTLGSGGGAATLLQSVNLQKAIDFDLCVCIQQLERAPHEIRSK